MSAPKYAPRQPRPGGLDEAAVSDLRDRLPADAPNRWVDHGCRYCKPGEPCLTHDRRPRTLAQNRVLFGPAFGYKPTAEDRALASFPRESQT
jgi:hypothetical protein